MPKMLPPSRLYTAKGEDNKSAKNKDGNLSKKITEFITRIFTEDGMDE